MRAGRAAAAALPIVAVVALVSAPTLPDWLEFLLTVALAKAFVVLGVAVLLRANLVSFGHGLYFATGAYTVGFAMKWLGLREALLLLPLGLVAGAAMAAIVGLFLARYRGIFFGMLSLGFSMILYSLLLKLYTVTGGTDGMVIQPMTLFGVLPAAGRPRLTALYYLTFVSAALAFAGTRRWLASPLGYLATAIRDNEVRVEYMGASVQRAVYRTYVLSGGLGALGGALVALTVGHIAPEFSYWTQSGEFVFATVLGGITSVFAPVVGSVVFEFVRSYAYGWSPNTWQLTLGVILMAIILFMPGGLWSVVEAGVPARNRP
jgi:branched-chain amino acid transport system permease protein